MLTLSYEEDPAVVTAGARGRLTSATVQLIDLPDGDEEVGGESARPVAIRRAAPVSHSQQHEFRFVNPAGLKSEGSNLFTATAASGAPMIGTPGLDGFGKLAQGWLEMSNVQVVEEMVNMIVAQRAYETNSKAIQAADDMLQTANNLRR